MSYYEVLPADGRYWGKGSLTYSYGGKLPAFSVVTVPMRQRLITAFVLGKVKKPDFEVKPIKTHLSGQPLPEHCLELARWLEAYYICSPGEALRQFAPTAPTVRRGDEPEVALETASMQLELEKPLTADQKKALGFIRRSPSTTILLHGDTGTGKTRVYLELAGEVLAGGKSVVMLTPEIALTSQLAAAIEKQLSYKTYVLHSQLTSSQRKKIWLAILEAGEPLIVVGPRSALFAPIKELGLIVVDEAHEPAYKQDQSPRYHAVRVASQLGAITGAKVVLGTATPSVTDYYLAEQRGAVVRMTQQALGVKNAGLKSQIIDLRDRSNFSRSPYLSNQLIDDIHTTLSAKKQVMVYLNRRGSARMILCQNCGWQALCPNCDVPLIYHGDEHITRCHICGYSHQPPTACPECGSLDVIYRSIGTKALAEAVSKLFPDRRLARFDSDNSGGERVHELYPELLAGKIDILVGTQVLAKGFDLPRLGLVGIISAESSMGLPDYGSEERSFQLLYQVIGRVGRGHGKGQVVLQSYEPGSTVLRSALERDWLKFYKNTLAERQAFRFPPFAYLLKLACRRTTLAGAEKAAERLKTQLAGQKLPVEIVGPAPGFYGRRGPYYYYHLVLKSKNRGHLVELAKQVPADWTIDLDPVNLL